MRKAAWHWGRKSIVQRSESLKSASQQTSKRSEGTRLVPAASIAQRRPQRLEISHAKALFWEDLHFEKQNYVYWRRSFLPQHSPMQHQSPLHLQEAERSSSSFDSLGCCHSSNRRRLCENELDCRRFGRVKQWHLSRQRDDAGS